MKCPRCSTENLDGNAYCSACGQPLDPKLSALEAVEKQLTEFKTASKAEFDKTTADFKDHLEQASGKELAAIHTRGQELLQTIDKQVDESSAIQQIKKDVKDLNTKFTFLTDSSVSADVKSKLDGALQQYQAYLKRVGFKADEDVDVRIGNDIPGAACFYDPKGSAGKPEIFINSDYASEPDLIFLEYARHVLLGERPTILSVAPAKGGSNDENWNYYAINSGLARYYACSFRGQPMFGTDGAGEFRCHSLHRSQISKDL